MGKEPKERKLSVVTPTLWVALLVIGVFGWRALQDVGARKVETSEFKRLLSEGAFTKVVLGPDWVRGLPKPGVKLPGAKEAKAGTPVAAGRLADDKDFLDRLERSGIPYDVVSDGGLGEMLWVWLVPIAAVLLISAWMIRRLGAQVGGQGPPVMSFGKTKARMHMEPETGVTFKDVAGCEEAVDELDEIVQFLKTPEKYRRLGGRIPKGVLLVGPPGTGKTLLARAVAGEAGVPFFSLSGSEFVEMFVGVGAARVRDLFQSAAAKAPAIIFIDELDAIGKSRNSGMPGGHDEREQTLNQMLAEMDGFDARVGLIVMGATNRPETLDAALMRPGRFDRQVLVDRPDKRGREQILRIHAKGVKLGPDVDLRLIAARTPGFAGADLANVVNEGALLAARRGKDEVTRSELDEAVERVVAGLEKKSRRLGEREKEIVAFHEAGHALVSWMLAHADRITKVSIIPRGVAALGYTLQLPIEDRHLLTRSELRDRMAGLLGGRAAEEEIFGEPSTGAANDLQQATAIARAMIQDYGMSATLGPVALSEDRGPGFLGKDGGLVSRSWSEETQKLVDREVQAMVGEAEKRAKDLVRQCRDKLEALAARLLAVEVMEEEEIAKLWGPKVERPGQGETPAEGLPVVSATTTSNS
jgi:cell division protease FtsH